jgi:hypothetical protein
MKTNKQIVIFYGMFIKGWKNICEKFINTHTNTQIYKFCCLLLLVLTSKINISYIILQKPNSLNRFLMVCNVGHV